MGRPAQLFLGVRHFFLPRGGWQPRARVVAWRIPWAMRWCALASWRGIPCQGGLWTWRRGAPRRLLTWWRGAPAGAARWPSPALVGLAAPSPGDCSVRPSGGGGTPIRSSWCQRKTCGCCDCIVHPPLSTSALPVSSWLRKSDAAARTRVAPPPVAAAGGCASQLSTRPPRRDTACRGEAACVCTSFCPTLGRDAACCSSPRLPSPPPPSPFGVFR